MRGHLAHLSGGHPEEPAHVVQGLLGLVDKLLVADQMHLVRTEELVEMGQLLAIATDLPVPPKGRPSRRLAFGLLGARRDEVGDRLQPVRPEVRPVGVGAVYGVAQDGDQLGVWHGIGDATVRLEIGQVQRRALPSQRPCGSLIEEGLVVLPPPDPLPIAVGVPRTAAVGGRAIT